MIWFQHFILWWFPIITHPKKIKACFFSPSPFRSSTPLRMDYQHTLLDFLAPAWLASKAFNQSLHNSTVPLGRIKNRRIADLFPSCWMFLERCQIEEMVLSKWLMSYFLAANGGETLVVDIYQADNSKVACGMWLGNGAMLRVYAMGRCCFCLPENPLGFGITCLCIHTCDISQPYTIIYIL